jgi:hypothetical protein
LNADELPAQFQPEFRLVPLGVASENGKSSTAKKNHIRRFRLLALEFFLGSARAVTILITAQYHDIYFP